MSIWEWIALIVAGVVAFEMLLALLWIVFVTRVRGLR